MSSCSASMHPVYYRSEDSLSARISGGLRRFVGLWQIVGMAQMKINFRRTTIARAKAAVKKHRAAKKKKPPRNEQDSPNKWN